MQEIKPKDVEGLIGEGKLHFGDELEFSFYDDFCRCFQQKFCGLSESEFYSCGQLFPYARYPRPDLRDGDPVYIKEMGNYTPAYFKEYGLDCIVCYPAGRYKWTKGRYAYSEFKNWRIPTPQELLGAGLDMHWYEGRRGIK